MKTPIVVRWPSWVWHVSSGWDFWLSLGEGFSLLLPYLPHHLCCPQLLSVEHAFPELDHHGRDTLCHLWMEIWIFLKIFLTISFYIAPWWKKYIYTYMVQQPHFEKFVLQKSLDKWAKIYFYRINFLKWGCWIKSMTLFFFALVSVAQLVGSSSDYWNFVGSIPGQGTYRCRQLDPVLLCTGGNQSMFLSLPFSLSKGNEKNVLGWGFKKKMSPFMTFDTSWQIIL